MAAFAFGGNPHRRNHHQAPLGIGLVDPDLFQVRDALGAQADIDPPGTVVDGIADGAIHA